MPEPTREKQIDQITGYLSEIHDNEGIEIVDSDLISDVYYPFPDSDEMSSDIDVYEESVDNNYVVPEVYGMNGTYLGEVKNNTEGYMDFNDVELVFAGTDRQKELGLYIDTEFEVYDPERTFNQYRLADNCEYYMINWESGGINVKISKDEFLNNLEYKWLFYVTFEHDEIICIEELYTP